MSNAITAPAAYPVGRLIPSDRDVIDKIITFMIVGI